MVKPIIPLGLCSPEWRARSWWGGRFPRARRARAAVTCLRAHAECIPNLDFTIYFSISDINRIVWSANPDARIDYMQLCFFLIGTKKNFSNTIENKVKLQGIRSGVVDLVDDPLTDSLKLVAQEIQMTGNRTFPVKDVGAAEMFAEQSLRRVDHLLRENLDHSNNNIKTT